MSTELDLFGNPLPKTTPPAPPYDRLGPKPLPVIPVLAQPAIMHTDTHRPHTIIKDGKHSAWLLYE